jgi:hypothetical protein
MLRKHILAKGPTVPASLREEKDIAALATVLVTSETVDHPIDNVFDTQRGPGGSRWVTAEPGEQVLILAFDVAQTIHWVSLEVEEREVSRTQELVLSVSSWRANLPGATPPGVHVQPARHHL